ncbi:S1C family serine protease [Olsenella phocaeensis]|uniref:S1C family serine protease n=1 Tax=Olsenella phocaeensis TaxID=1852385 RepID=UPI0009317088|nr:trypsin-like peptidase domain-containing protein [Olsenella phocaeensis]
MATFDENRPPVPGAPAQPDDQTQVAATQVHAQAAHAQEPFGSVPPSGVGQAPAKGPRRGGVAKGAVFGAVGGVLGAAALVFALKAGGVIGGTQIIKTTDSSAGQTVNITASDQDVSVAQAVAAKALPSVVSVNVTTSEGSGIGSGVILDADGNIITNYHVIDGATAISVSYGGKSYDASVVGSDSSSDLAVIKVDWAGTEVTPVEVDDSSKLVVGDWVMSIGSPFGLDQSVSAGIVSSLSRNQLMQSSSGNTLYTNLIQTDAAINPGNSGGALVDSQGKLVGICTLYSSSTESSASVGFAIPSNYAVAVANKIIAGQTVTHAYIGLSMQTVNSQNATMNNLAVNQGAYVSEVTSGSPADTAGIQKGDIITAVNGESIISADGMILNIRSHEIGETVAVTFMRGTSEQTVNVTLGSDEALQEQQKGSGSDQGNSGSDSGNGISTNDLYRYLEELYNQRNQQNDPFGNRGGGYSQTQQDGSQS